MIVCRRAVVARAQFQGHDPSAAENTPVSAHHGYLMKVRGQILTAAGYTITDYSCAAQTRPRRRRGHCWPTGMAGPDAAQAAGPVSDVSNGSLGPRNLDKLILIMPVRISSHVGNTLSRT